MPSSSADDSIAKWILIAPIIAVTFLLKFALPVAGEQIFLSAIILLGVALFGFISGRLEIHKKRLSFYMVTVGILALTQLLGGYEISLPSFFMLIAIHAPYVLGMKKDLVPAGVEMKAYQKILIVLAALGIMQYFLQFVIGADYAYFLDTKFPEAFIMQGFNALNMTTYQSGIYKSNGVFLSEPSSFSQILALAIVIQILFFHEIKRLVLFTVSLAVTFSGTGLAILFCLLPIYLLHKKKFIILSSLLVLVLSAPVWAPYVGLEKTVKRSTEITREGSSGFARFFGPMLSINEVLIPEGNNAVLFGMGAGSMLRQAGGKFDFETATSTWGKMIFEYGVLGSLIYFCFMAYLLFSSGKNPYLIAAITIQFMFLGEYIFPPSVHGLILALLVWPCASMKDEKAQSEKSQAVVS